MRVAGHWYKTRDLWLNPSYSIKVQNLNVVKAFVAIVATEHIKFSAHSGHSVASARTGLLTQNFGLRPNETHGVEHVEVIEPLIAVVSAMVVNFIAVDSSRVIVAAGGFGPEGLWFRATN